MLKQSHKFAGFCNFSTVPPLSRNPSLTNNRKKSYIKHLNQSIKLKSTLAHQLLFYMKPPTGFVPKTLTEKVKMYC